MQSEKSWKPGFHFNFSPVKVETKLSKQGSDYMELWGQLDTQLSTLVPVLL